MVQYRYIATVVVDVRYLTYDYVYKLELANDTGKWTNASSADDISYIAGSSTAKSNGKIKVL